MTKFFAKSASRALGFLICKDKALGGMPFKCFTKCYNPCTACYRLWFFCMGNKGLSMCRCCAEPCLSLFSGAWEICSNPCCGRGHEMVNEKMAKDDIHGQILF